MIQKDSEDLQVSLEGLTITRRALETELTELEV